MKTIIYQVCFGIPNLTKMDYHKLISYSIAQSTLMYPLLNHNLKVLSPKQQQTQKPRIVYQPQNLEIPSEYTPTKIKFGIRKNQFLLVQFVQFLKRKEQLNNQKSSPFDSNKREIHCLTTWLSEICLTSLIALSSNFPLF